jgi:excisionase family DNA binding protein
MQDERLLRPRDVAHILDCCPDDLYPLIYTGEIKAQKVGRLWKFRLEDVMDYRKRVNGHPVRTEQNGKVGKKTPEEVHKRL